MSINLRDLGFELDGLREARDNGEEYDVDRLEALEGLESDVGGDLHVAHNQGCTLIAEEDFEDHARDLAEDLHGRVTEWPFSCIDWRDAANELRSDYTTIEFDGDTFYTRDV